MTSPRDLVVQVVGPSAERRSVNGDAVSKIRGMMKISQAEFAEFCGWSQQYQCGLERPGRHERSKETADKIIEAFDHYAVRITDQVE
jgi:transcriptional regulator with XRE-family HTH domain